MVITYDVIDTLIDEMENMVNDGMSLPVPYYPTPNDIKRMQEEPNKYLRFAVFLSVNNPVPRPDQLRERESMKLLNQFIAKCAGNGDTTIESDD